MVFILKSGACTPAFTSSVAYLLSKSGSGANCALLIVALSNSATLHNSLLFFIYELYVITNQKYQHEFLSQGTTE